MIEIIEIIGETEENKMKREAELLLKQAEERYKNQNINQYMKIYLEGEINTLRLLLGKEVEF